MATYVAAVVCARTKRLAEHIAGNELLSPHPYLKGFCSESNSVPTLVLRTSINCSILYALYIHVNYKSLGYCDTVFGVLPILLIDCTSSCRVLSVSWQFYQSILMLPTCSHHSIGCVTGGHHHLRLVLTLSGDSV